MGRQLGFFKTRQAKRQSQKIRNRKNETIHRSRMLGEICGLLEISEEEYYTAKEVLYMIQRLKEENLRLSRKNRYRT